MSEIDFEFGKLILHGTQQADWAINHRREDPHRVGTTQRQLPG